MSSEQLNAAIRSVSTLSQWHEQGALYKENEKSEKPYDFKGDRLGMELEDFKRKHYRKVGEQVAPFTSENTAGERIETLLSEAWHPEAGIIHCSLDFPFERFRGREAPTVAGIDVEFLIYRFVDKRLFRISAFFDTRSFDSVRAALIERYGSLRRRKRSLPHSFGGMVAPLSH